MNLIAEADQSVFEAEKMTAATYSGLGENIAIRDAAIAIYEEKTGLKASTRRLYDLGISLYLEKHSNK